MSVVERARGKHLDEGDYYVGDSALFAAALLKAYDALRFIEDQLDGSFGTDVAKARAREVIAELDA